VFAFDFMDNKDRKWWELDKQTLAVYKQIVFPAGIQIAPDKKVYIPKVSPIYTYKTKETPRKEAFCGDFHDTGDPGGIRTRDLLDENQISWTTRRRGLVDAYGSVSFCLPAKASTYAYASPLKILFSRHWLLGLKFCEFAKQPEHRTTSVI
jgi:hypothetical protein